MGVFALLAILSSLMLYLVLGDGTSASDLRAEYIVPSLRFQDLDTDHHQLKDTLSKSGLGFIAVTDIPDLGDLRKAVFSSLLDCSEHAPEAFEFTNALGESTQRKAIASQIMRHVPRPLPNDAIRFCPKLAAAAPSFRNVISEVSNAFTAALDRQYSLHMSRFKKPPYSSFAAVQAEGAQLEHFVAYTSKKEGHDSPLELHVDDGLFIAFTPPVVSKGEVGSGLAVQLPSGQLATVKYTCSDCVLFMIGGGFSRWLGGPVPGVVHALRMPAGVTRVWYGRMFLPPLDGVALLPSGTVMDFESYRSLQNSSSFLEEQGLSCMGRRVENGKLIRKLTDDCPAQEFHCWMKCYQQSELPSCDSTQQLACQSNSDGSDCQPTQMGCGPRCVAKPTNTSKDGKLSKTAVVPASTFCDAHSAVTMYMEGFLVPSWDGRQSCVRLLFTSWILDTPSKYAGGCVGTFLFGVFVEFLSVVRRKINPEFPKWAFYGAHMLVLGAQACCGYLLMFMAMTFSVPIFCAAVFGLMVGHVLFNVGIPKHHDRPHC